MSHQEIILCCAGPSLDPEVVEQSITPERPCAALSTAMRHLHHFATYWIMIDPPFDSRYANRNYAPDGGMCWMRDPAICKVIPERKKTHLLLEKFPECRNIRVVPYSGSRAKEESEGRTFMDGSLPLLRSAHMSLPFAIQWLITAGYTRLYFAGVDLNSRPDKLRSWYDGPSDRKKADSMNKSHAKCLDVLRQWTPIACEKGIEFISMTPGSPINRLMPSLTAPLSPHPYPARDRLQAPSPA